ncbi:MAG TPA: hypothetical protein VFQ78_14930 [Candidatus Udaeobacter sp.]|nr:hypothetical protein [Candidatus Udaeobacter sp.]
MAASVLSTLTIILLAQSKMFGLTAAEAFADLHCLIGDWEATTQSGSIIRVSYRAIANDSAIVETFTTASGAETLTIYPDGQEFVATHYCAQGNQPRLCLTAFSSKKHFEFSFHDATNLRTPGAPHLTRLRLQLKDAGHFDKVEVYTENGKDDEATLKFCRLQ